MGALAVRATSGQNRAVTLNTHRHVARHSSRRAFRDNRPYTLDLRFDDETQQRIDFRPVLEGQLFDPLRDLTTFNAVILDPEAGTLVWPNGEDFDPATLHDWPLIREEIVSMARGWADQSQTGRQ